jgi:hypothetical protein
MLPRAPAIWGDAPDMRINNVILYRKYRYYLKSFFMLAVRYITYQKTVRVIAYYTAAGRYDNRMLHPYFLSATKTQGDKLDKHMKIRNTKWIYN